ncbi:usherin-like [Erpetoichthys calabaricus]|uniref:usherin-like n=1 Tax=Erpetoichthys calabaricus TaxID=27687 RepID=UPI002233FFDB|nr:usherin-like [Erpetoichthys calabaricus]
MSRLLTCVALFILLEAHTMVTLAGHSQSCQEHCKETCWTHSFQKQKGFECCGGRPYNKASHVCCEDGRIIRGEPGMSCCGNQSFHPDLESCCEGRVIRGIGVKCCRGSPYNKTSAICCEGEIHENYNEMDSQCCGSKPYYPRIQKCCNHEILPRTPGMLCCGKILLGESTWTKVQVSAEINGTGVVVVGDHSEDATPVVPAVNESQVTGANKEVNAFDNGLLPENALTGPVVGEICERAETGGGVAVESSSEVARECE